MVRRTKKETNKQMWTEADKSKQEQMKINKQTNKNTQLQNKIKLKKKKQNKQNFFFVPHSWQDQKNIFLFFYPAQNLPSFYIHFRQF